ncbi:MAG TPA: VOC family protein [Usitatibacteraceae bacterium]
MKPGMVMRVARPSDNLAAIAEMYRRGLGFEILGHFADHDGFDGMILGHPAQPYHLEFTALHGHFVGRSPSQDNLLVFYLPDRVEWERCCAQMLAAGFRQLASYNPYWDKQGRTFEDLDGYRVVLQHAAWEK